MYGGKVVYPWQIEIRHPETEEMMTFEAPPPPDIQNLIEQLRKYRKK
jgi:hypothetical protein